MLFIRTNDVAEITTPTGIINFSKDKRKGNIIKKFIINKEYKNTEEAIKYFDDELIAKMIPKKSLQLLKSHPIKIITTANENVFVFQDLDCKVKFLTIDNDTGKIIQISFDDIIAQEDSILCYDGEDWYLDDVDSTFIFYNNDEEENEKENDEDDDFENMELSNYIINSENGGVIINNIFII